MLKWFQLLWMLPPGCQLVLSLHSVRSGSFLPGERDSKVKEHLGVDSINNNHLPILLDFRNQLHSRTQRHLPLQCLPPNHNYLQPHLLPHPLHARKQDCQTPAGGLDVCVVLTAALHDDQNRRVQLFHGVRSGLLQRDGDVGNYFVDPYFLLAQNLQNNNLRRNSKNTKLITNWTAIPHGHNTVLPANSHLIEVSGLPAMSRCGWLRDNNGSQLPFARKHNVHPLLSRIQQCLKLLPHSHLLSGSHSQHCTYFCFLPTTH